MNTIKNLRFKRLSGSMKGFTLMELMIAAVISSLVFASVVFIQYITARTLNDLYAPTRARSARMIALNQIRFRLCDAKIGSVEVLDGNHRIRFEDPNLISEGIQPRSEFFFDATKRTLYYNADVNHSEPERIARGPINIIFRKGSRELDPPDYNIYKGTDSVVTVLVQTSQELSYSKVDLREGETVIYLRNQ